MNFQDFKKDVESAFKNMIADTLFVADVDKDLLWTGYLLSFKNDDIRQDHNCNACKSFIRHYGKVVAIDPKPLKLRRFGMMFILLGMRKPLKSQLSWLRKQELLTSLYRM